MRWRRCWPQRRPPHPSKEPVRQSPLIPADAGTSGQGQPGNREELAMSDGGRRYAGGYLCGALRYEADGEPPYTGYCYCNDCRKASGSGCIPFMGFSKAAVRFSGETRKFASKAARGRTRCAIPARSAAALYSVGKSASTTHSRSTRAPSPTLHPSAPRSRSSPAIARPGLLFQLTWWSSTRCRPRT
jgi:hypothetical protein